MKRMIATSCVLVMMSGGIWAWQSAPQSSAVQNKPTAQSADAGNKKKTASNKTASSKKTVSKKNRKVATAVPQLPTQTMPPMPATLMNSAPVKPNVTMDRGLLTIDAPNSTLSDVLNGVHKATGATIEGAHPTERVAVKLGPGTPEQVIAALLRGTTYDYVILGSLGKQDVVTRVLLTQQTSQSGGEPSSQAMGRPQQPTPQPPPEDSNLPEAASPEDASPQATPDNEAERTQQDPQSPQVQDPNAPKTPEQLFKELQELQKQPK